MRDYSKLTGERIPSTFSVAKHNELASYEPSKMDQIEHWEDLLPHQQKAYRDEEDEMRGRYLVWCSTCNKEVLRVNYSCSVCGRKNI